jgi:hypothetical protein
MKILHAGIRLSLFHQNGDHRFTNAVFVIFLNRVQRRILQKSRPQGAAKGL